jgi:hypothetical protein
MKQNDGGPAFARPASVDPSSGTLSDGDSVIAEQRGMTLRDYFAAQALAGYSGSEHEYATTSATAKHCYDLADAMLRAREADNA